MDLRFVSVFEVDFLLCCYDFVTAHNITSLITLVSPESDELLLQYYLQMDGRGSFHFNPIESDTEEFGS